MPGVLIVQSDRTKKAHLGLKKAEFAFIILAVFTAAFTLGIFFRKPASGVPLKMESVASQPSAAQASAASSAAAPGVIYMKKININTASLEELKDLPEIGEVLAGRIISYRKANGIFKKTEDIMKVGGIGEKTYEKIKDMITIE